MLTKKQLMILSGIMLAMLVVVIVLASLAWYVQNERVDATDTTIKSQEVATVNLINISDIDPDKASYNGETALGYFEYVSETGLEGYTYMLDAGGNHITRSFLTVDTVVTIEEEIVGEETIEEQIITFYGKGLVRSELSAISFNEDGTQSVFVFANEEYELYDEVEAIMVYAADGGLLFSTADGYESGYEISKTVTEKAFYAVSTSTSVDYAYTMGKTFEISVTLNPSEAYREMHIAPKELIIAPIFDNGHIEEYLQARADDESDALAAGNIYYTRMTYWDGEGVLKAAVLYSLKAPEEKDGTTTYYNDDGSQTVVNADNQISIRNKDGSDFEYYINAIEIEQSTAYFIPEEELCEHYTWSITFAGDPQTYYPDSNGSGRLVYFDESGTEQIYRAVASNLEAEITLYFMDYQSYMNARELVYNYNASVGGYFLDPSQINTSTGVLTVKGTDKTVKAFNFSDYCYMGSTYIVYLAVNTKEAS